jgi:hypothetical protein
MVKLSDKTRTLCNQRKEMRHPLRFNLAFTATVCGCAFIAVFT